jgi:hypothetical protein
MEPGAAPRRAAQKLLAASFSRSRGGGTGKARSAADVSTVGFGPEVDDARPVWRYTRWASMVAGAVIFAAGLLVGWLIWG